MPKRTILIALLVGIVIGLLVSPVVASLRYFLFVAMYGDTANDWLTHMPVWWADCLEPIGQWLSQALPVGFGADMPAEDYVPGWAVSLCYRLLSLANTIAQG